MKTKLPTPDKEYLELASRRRALLEQSEPKSPNGRLERSHELSQLKDQLEKSFQQAFGFKRDQLKLAERLYWRFCNTELKPEGNAFDHTAFFQHGSNLVILSQPYYLDPKKLALWADTVGASVIIAKEWAYYYPGRATLFFAEFTPQAKANFDKRLRKL